MAGIRLRGRKQLLDAFKEKKRYPKLKDEALGFTLWGTGFGKKDSSDGNTTKRT